MNRRTMTLLLVCLVQLGLVGAATAAQLSARMTGDEYLLRVEPIDPLDPFRGTYVELSYPDLVTSRWRVDEEVEPPPRGDVYVPLTQHGALWQGDEWSSTRPTSGPYLACERPDWQVRCGIESLFVPQDEARALEQAVSEGTMYARIKVDARGHAAVVGLVRR